MYNSGNNLVWGAVIKYSEAAFWFGPSLIRKICKSTAKNLSAGFVLLVEFDLEFGLEFAAFPFVRIEDKEIELVSRMSRILFRENISMLKVGQEREIITIS